MVIFITLWCTVVEDETCSIHLSGESVWTSLLSLPWEALSCVNASQERTQVWPWCCCGLPAWPWVRVWAIMAFSVPSIVKRSLRPLFPWMMLFTLLASPRAQALTTSLCCLGYNTWELLFLFITMVVKKSMEGGSLEVGGPFGGVELVQFPRSGQNINMSLVYGCVTHADRWCCCCSVAKLCPTLCYPMDCSRCHSTISSGDVLLVF